MYEELNQEIVEAKERVRKRERILGLIKHAEENLKHEVLRRDVLKEILEKEELDVKKLEGLSIKGIFLAVLGNKEDKLDKEKAEFMAAKLKYDECCNSIKVVQIDLDDYYRQLRDIRNANDEYENLIRRKEQLVMQANDKNTRDILGLMEKAGDLKSDLRELQEAITAGNSVLSALKNAANSLDSAEGWGTWDMLGGGLVSDMAKHSHIDAAVDYINEAKSSLNRFKRELADVNLSVDVSVDISSFDKFADFFFDGIFADWNMQSKIQNSSHSVNSAIYRIDNIINSLKTKYSHIEVDLSNIKIKIKDIIECA